MAENSSAANQGANISIGTGGDTGYQGSQLGGGTASVDFSGGNPNAGVVEESAPVDTGYTGGYANGASVASNNAATTRAAAIAAAQAAAQAAAEKAEDQAKKQAKDRKIANDTLKSQQERRSMPKAPKPPLRSQSQDRAQINNRELSNQSVRNNNSSVKASDNSFDSSSKKRDKESNSTPFTKQQEAAAAKAAATMGAVSTISTPQLAKDNDINTTHRSNSRHARGGGDISSETTETINNGSANNLAPDGKPYVASGGIADSIALDYHNFKQGRGSKIGSAGQRTPGVPVPPQRTQPQINQQQRTSAKQASQRNGARVSGSRRPNTPAKPKSARELIDDIFARNAGSILNERGEEIAETKYGQSSKNFFENHPEFNQSDTSRIAAMLSEYERDKIVPEPLMRSNYRTFDNPDAEPSGVGTTKKDTSHIDRMIDNLVNDMMLGWFHIQTERRVKNKNGSEDVRWSAPVEDAMLDIMDYFGLDRGIRGQQTVFRLVRLYASMGIDSNGNMFNQEEDQWSLTEKEFTDICRLILKSCVDHGHPMAMPAKRYNLRRTDIYPSGVMPKMVAQELTGPNSQLNMTAADLVEACQNEWNTRTYPTLKANLLDNSDEETGRNPIAQRYAIERMQQAIARIDDISAEDFSRRYSVDTTLHYRLSEYLDQNVEYVTAANGNYDSEAVADKLAERINYYTKDAMKQKGIKFNEDGPYDTIEVEGVKHQSWVTGGANLITSLARINSIIFRPVLAIASLNENAVGKLRTKFALDTLRALETDGQSRYTIDDSYHDIAKTDEFVKSFDAAKMLFEIGGPGAARLFTQEGKPCTHENVLKFLQEKYIRDPSNASKLAGGINEARKKLQSWSQKLMVGDLVFKKADTVNWLNAFLLSNAVRGNTQNELLQEGIIDTSGSVSLTGDEIEDIMDAHKNNIAGFITEALGTDAGIDAFNMMRANSIAQINPVSYYSDRFLRDHGVINMMITMFVDTFPTYGLNFIYNIVPFSRTIAYLGVKKTQGNNTDNSIMNSDLVIGGNFNDTGINIDDPGFQAGLRMNLVFDAMTLGHNLLVGGILGLTFLMLGFEPPDDDQNIYNISMWKIGGKEIQWAWWLNDLTLLGMPFAYYIAVGSKTQDWQLAGELMLDSLHDQVDGNVVLDFADIISNWRHDLMDFEQMSKDPKYTGPRDMTSFALMELYSNLLRAGNKITPGAPLFDSLSRSALFQGIDARTVDYRHVFSHSSTDSDLDEWYKKHEVTETVDSYMEMLDRKYSTGNWLYAIINNTLRYKTLGNDQKTGFFWWEMPKKTYGDNLAYIWAQEFNVDYDNMPEGMDKARYNEEVACHVLDYIKQFQEQGMDAAEAVKNYGLIIPEPARKATLEHMYNELATLDQEWINRNASGELADKNEYQVAKGIYYQRRSDINSLIYDWLKNDDIPDWGVEYEQLLTDYDITYVYEDTGKPVPASNLGTWIDQFDPNVEAVYIPKGNHPTSLLPWTEVDYSDNITNRGYNAETVPYWWHDGMTGSDADALRNITLSNGQTLADQIIPRGRDTDKRFGDVTFGMQNRGFYSNPDEPTTGWRALVPKKVGLSDEIREYGKEYEEAWKEQKNNISNAAWNSSGRSGSRSGGTMYPRRSYGGSGYSSRGGYSKSSNYNPKIYSTKVYNSKISNSRVYNNSRINNSRINNSRINNSNAVNTRIDGTRISSPRASVNPRQVNVDRAANMGTRNPQDTSIKTYLRPGFSTKGSREAYKRQDI